MHREKLDSLVKDGSVAEIFQAEQALSILVTTGAFATEINEKNYGEVFSTFQTFCIDQFVLSVTRRYEVPRRNRLRSLPAVLNYFQEKAGSLEITEPRLLHQQLVWLGLYSSEFDGLSPVEKNLFVHEKLSEQLPNIGENETLVALKSLRDKKIAHPEDINIESLPRTVWEEAEKLLQYPKDVVGVIGDGYLSTAYMLENGEYLLTSMTLPGLGAAPSDCLRIWA